MPSWLITAIICGDVTFNYLPFHLLTGMVIFLISVYMIPYHFCTAICSATFGGEKTFVKS